MWSGPILDDHFHLREDGRCVDAARDFERSGGTDLILVHVPSFTDLPRNEAEINEAYDQTLSIAERVRKETELSVRVLLGPHPAIIPHLASFQDEEIGVDSLTAACDIHRRSVEIAAERFEEGMCVGIGEIGRPHWTVENNVHEACEEAFIEALSIAKEVGAPGQRHVESGFEEVYADLEPLVRRHGPPIDQVVRHHAPALLGEQTHGLVPSIILGSGDIPTLVEQIGSHPSAPFLLETDYMDDPRRPGAVLGPRTVPRRTQALFEHGVDEKTLWATHCDIPNRLYGPADDRP